MAIKTDVELDRFELREILLRGSEFWNNWRSENPSIVIDLSGADLRWARLIEANLNGAILNEANLSGTNFSGADLSGADLSGADLRWTILSGAYIRGTNCSGADLRWTNFSEADLRWTNLSGTNLIGANLSEADLRWTILSEADLSGANLSGANLIGANLLLTQGIDPKISETTFNIKIFDQDIDSSTLEEINTAVSNYAEAAGYTAPEIISEKRGSFFRDIRYKVAKILSPEVREEATRTGEDLYRRGKANVQARLEQPGVESTKQLAEATAQLLKSIEGVDNAILTLGKVIVVKYTNQNGKSITIVRTVSTEIQHQLEEMPHLLNSPRALIKFLNASKEEPSIESAKVINQ